MIFNFENFQWTAIAQRGFLPEARWSASLAYSSHSNQLFLFGGHGAQGGTGAGLKGNGDRGAEEGLLEESQQAEASYGVEIRSPS